ncbi:hypothetical protein FPQ18DRAFT_414175, partial [Pyronema domesticum]
PHSLLPLSLCQRPIQLSSRLLFHLSLKTIRHLPPSSDITIKMSNPSSFLPLPDVDAAPSASLPATSSVPPPSPPVHASSAVQSGIADLAEAAAASPSPAPVPSTSSVFVLSPAPLPTQKRTLQLAGLPTDGTVIFDRLSPAERAAAVGDLWLAYPDVERHIVATHIRWQCHKLRSEKKRQAGRQAKAAAARAAAAAAVASAVTVSTSAAVIPPDSLTTEVAGAVFASLPPVLQAAPEEQEDDDEYAIFTNESFKSAVEIASFEGAEEIPKSNKNL